MGAEATATQDLAWADDIMHCVYLSKPSDSEQAMHRSRALISVDSAQLGKAKWQVPVAVMLVLIHCNVERAVHRAQLIHLLLDLHSPTAIDPGALIAIMQHEPLLLWGACNSVQHKPLCVFKDKQTLTNLVVVAVPVTCSWTE